MDGRLPRVETRMNDSPSDPLTFEQSLAELDQVVRDLEDGQLGLEEALGRYETGVSLLKRCYAQLRQAEQRILQLTGTDTEGQPMTQPFQHTATAEAAQETTKLRRRPAGEDQEMF
jgi:exodeoxyribonuclease VII small subunit